MVGDSVGEGYWASDLTRNSWAELLRASLTATGGDGGSGFQGMQRSSTFLEGAPSGASRHYRATPENAWTQTGGWHTPTWPYGPAYGALVGTAAGAGLTIPFSGTELRIWYIDRGGAWSYSVDDRAPTPVAPAGSNSPMQVHQDRLAPGRHTVRITANAPDSPWLSGVEGSNQAGVRLDNFSIAGLSSGAWNNADPWHSGRLVGGIDNPADLVIYELGGNDVAGAVHQSLAATAAGSTEVQAGPGWLPTDIGALVTGPGISAGTTVSSFNLDHGSVVLSQPATATDSKVTLTVTVPDVIRAWLDNLAGYLLGMSVGGDRPDIVLLWPSEHATPQIEQRITLLREQALAVAQSRGLAFVDINQVADQPWSDWCAQGRAGNPDDPTRAGDDGGHPSDAGHRLMADTLSRMIVPVPG